MRDLYNERKAEDSGFSYRYIAQKAGFSSAGFFTKVLQGRSNISAPLIFKFAEVFKLTKAQTDYFNRSFFSTRPLRIPKNGIISKKSSP